MTETVKAYRVSGGTNCYHSEYCKGRKYCGRINSEVEIGIVLVDPEAEDLSDANFEVQKMALQWRERDGQDEEECTRKDNYWNGKEPVTVFRAAYHLASPLFELPSDGPKDK